jgi:putative protease
VSAAKSPCRRLALTRWTSRACANSSGRLGETPFALGELDVAGLAEGLFLPMSELNHVRQRLVDELLLRRDWAASARAAEREATIAAAIASVPLASPATTNGDAGLPCSAPRCIASKMHEPRRRAALPRSRSTRSCVTPAPPAARVRALAEELSARGVSLRLRTPSIVRPEDRRSLDKWLALDVPMLTDISDSWPSSRARPRRHRRLRRELLQPAYRRGDLSPGCSPYRAVDRADNERTPAVSAPWNGRGFDVLVYGRPEGMTDRALRAVCAFDREPTTCRDLCVQKHPVVQITDPTGYTFGVATDSACRNRLLHSRPIEASEYLPRLWQSGIRGFRTVFNVPGDPHSRRRCGVPLGVDALAAQSAVPASAVRELVGTRFTRGHFARAV